MKRLILFRHGRAEPHSSSGDDFDRKLDPQGVTEAAVTGRTLADLGLIPDVAHMAHLALRSEGDLLVVVGPCVGGS